MDIANLDVYFSEKGDQSAILNQRALLKLINMSGMSGLKVERVMTNPDSSTVLFRNYHFMAGLHLQGTVSHTLPPLLPDGS